MASSVRADDSEDSAKSAEHRTVSRVMGLLEIVVASEPNGLRLADLATMIGAPKSSIHGLAKGLAATGYFREHQNRYYRGPAVGMLALGDSQTPAVYHHALERLSATWSETAILATLAGESVINIDVVEPNQVIRASPPVHIRRPMWPGSYGKVFLAFMDPKRRDTYLMRNHRNVEERSKIMAELETIRSTGVAFNRGETEPEYFGVASPIRIPGIDVTLAIGLAGPAGRMTAQLDDIAAAVLSAAQGLSGPN